MRITVTPSALAHLRLKSENRRFQIVHENSGCGGSALVIRIIDDVPNTSTYVTMVDDVEFYYPLQTAQKVSGIHIFLESSQLGTVIKMSPDGDRQWCGCGKSFVLTSCAS